MGVSASASAKVDAESPEGFGEFVSRPVVTTGADAAGGGTAGGDAAGGGAAAPPVEAGWQADWNASGQAASTNADAAYDGPTNRAAKQQAEIQRLRMELERLEAIHQAEFAPQAKPPAQPQQAQ